MKYVYHNVFIEITAFFGQTFVFAVCTKTQFNAIKYRNALIPFPCFRAPVRQFAVTTPI